MANGESYEKERVPITDAKTATRACLHMILKHTADMFVGIVEIVSETYKIDPDEMMNVITSHPRYKEMTVDPVMLDLGYILDPAAAEPKPAATVAKPKVRVMKIKPKVVAQAEPQGM